MERRHMAAASAASQIRDELKNRAGMWEVDDQVDGELIDSLVRIIEQAIIEFDGGELQRLQERVRHLEWTYVPEDTSRDEVEAGR